MKYYCQHDTSDCGAACLAMIFSHYRKFLTVTELRECSGTDVKGTSFKGLIDACERNGFRAVGAKGMPQELKLDVPCIAHLAFSDGYRHIEHYVVIRKARCGKVEVWDPNSEVGKTIVSYSRFRKKWTGRLLFIVPDYTFKPSKSEKASLWKFVPIITKHKKILSYTTCSSLLLIVMSLLSSLFQKVLFDEVLFSNAIITLRSLFVGMFLLEVFSISIDAIRNLFLRHLSYKSDLQLDFSFIEHVFRLSPSFFETRKTGEILSRLTDLKEIRDCLSSIALSLIIDFLMIVIIAPMLCVSDYRFFLVSIACSILVCIASTVCAKLYKRMYRKLKDQGAELYSFLMSVVNGMNVIKGLNAERSFLTKYRSKRMDMAELNWKVDDFALKHYTFNCFINSASNLLLLWFGCTSILEKKMSLGTMFFLISLSSSLIKPLLRIATLQSEMQQAFVSAERVGEVLSLNQNEIESKLIKIQLQGSIKFDNVCFHYGSRPRILNNLSFSIEPGNSVAIVGSSGCGKSTIIKLLLKFYNPDSGRITIDDIDLHDIDTRILRFQIGYIPQEFFFFPDTIVNNITMCDDRFSLEQVIKVAKLVGIHEYIESLPNGYNSMIGENGNGLSGGEKQRIAIARAVLKNPPIIVFDEVTNNLDTMSESRVHELIKAFNKKTLIIISHRISTVSHCNKVLFLEKGLISDIGNHHSLMKTNSTYRDYWIGNEDAHH